MMTGTGQWISRATMRLQKKGSEIESEVATYITFKEGEE